MARDDARSGWRLDRRVNVSTLLAVATSMAVVISLAANVRTRMGVLEDKLCRVELRMDETRATVIKVERIEERISSIRDILVDIKRQLREGGHAGAQ
jgi:hypothetical protein